jgi:LPXTG-site transpeptidase (sortase) family protein
MDEKPRPRNISPAEAIAALFVMFIWSGVFLMALIVVLGFLRSQTQVAMPVAQEPTPVVWVITATSVPVQPTVGPKPSVAATSAATASIVAVPPTPSTALALAAGPTRALPTAPLPEQARPRPTRAAVVRSPTATRVILPTPLPEVTSTPWSGSDPSERVARRAGETVVHSVAAGETLSSIAALYGSTVDSLVRANDLDDPARLKIGQKLTVPGESGATPAPVEQASVPTVAASFSVPATPALNARIEPPPPAGDPPTRISIPKIKLDSKIVEVAWHLVQEGGRMASVWEVADFAAGWHRGSAFPGNIGNTVISGHHNIKGEVFRYVVDLEEGDEVDVYVNEQRYPYVVKEKYILREKGVPDEVRNTNARWIAKTTDERLTLVTCWPYTNNTHRVIVVARPMWK